jgi:phage-related protein
VVDIVFHKEGNNAPVWEWLQTLGNRAQDKCSAKILRLRELGREMRRPEADYLEDGIYELRISYSGLQYRILYLFHKRRAVVLTHAFLKKTRKVPKKEIGAALKRKEAFEREPKAHTYII